MSIKNRPYLQLYVQDYLTDERLSLCSAASQGIFIKIMCILHKSETYGEILLKQNFKQNSSTVSNFAYMFARLIGFEKGEIENALLELLENKVLSLDGETLFQKRMVKDGRVSESRSISGKKGGKISANFAQAKLQAKFKQTTKQNFKQNAEYENEYENEYEIKKEEEGVGEGEKKFNLSESIGGIKPTNPRYSEYLDCLEKIGVESPEMLQKEPIDVVWEEPHKNLASVFCHNLIESLNPIQTKIYTHLFPKDSAPEVIGHKIKNALDEFCLHLVRQNKMHLLYNEFVKHFNNFTKQPK